MGGKRRYNGKKRPDVQLALKEGWTYVRRSSSGHLIFAHPRGGPTLSLAATPGGGRGDRNAIAWIRTNTPREATT